MAATRTHQAAGPQWATLRPALLTSRLMMLKAIKSQTMATTVTAKAASATAVASSEPSRPEPRQSRKLRKLRMVATGCRTMTRVSTRAVDPAASLKEVPSRRETTAAAS